MNKTQLIDVISNKAEITSAEAYRALDATLEAITGTLKNGESVQLVGFGTFSIQDKAARKGRNPKTGEELDIAASKAVKFKSGKQLREAVSGK